jgi:3-oxoadipate enol-lactonase
MYYEQNGEGTPVVLLHEAIGDSRMWDPQWSSFAGRYRALRCDLPGFGRSPIDKLPVGLAAEVVALLDELAISAAGVVGCSMSGRIASEIAVARPDLVGALVLGAPGLPGFDWSESMEAFWAAEEEAVRRGDLDAAVELNLGMWVDGPRRTSADVDSTMRERIGEMQRRAFELQAPHWDELEEEPLVSDLPNRIGEIQAPTLVLIGEEDVDDLRRIADIYVERIPNARLESIPGVAHAFNMERPDIFDKLVLDFLADVLSPA